jgi:hypothetical protein
MSSPFSKNWAAKGEADAADAAGDVLATFADIDDLTREVGFRPRPQSRTHSRFVTWYRDHYRI